MSKFEFPNAQKQKELGSVWERAVQGIYVPREDGTDDVEEVRIRARKYVENKGEEREIPNILKRGIWYSVTGYNPLGEHKDQDENQRSNSRLLKILQQTYPSRSPSSPRRILRSYGTEEGAQWREDGFLVQVVGEATVTGGKEEAEKKFLEIGREFGQAALYRLEWVGEEKEGGEKGKLLQNVKACFAEMRGVESEADVARVL